ncbi:hypothetical protein JW935_05380, partial [candidate division KSB1 bacterium]|nr:hypothetical protein [candidate division KSB1 bacterium]
MKKKLSFSLLTLLQFTLFTSLFAQQTGYTDLFDGPVKVSGPPSFSFQQENGILNIMVDKEPSKRWQGVYYDIGEIIDISARPVMNVKLKSDESFLLTAYIVDTADNNMTQNVKIYATDIWVDYCIDFSDFNGAGVDAAQIKALIFTPNGNSNDGLLALVQMDKIKIGDDAQKFAGIGGIASMKTFQGSVGYSISVLDLENFSDLIVSGGTVSVTNLKVSIAYSGPSNVSFDCLPGFIGTDTLNITAVGSTGYEDNTIKVPLEVEGNIQPYMNDIENMDIMASDTVTIRLTGIDDGNSTIQQPLQLSAVSDNPSALPNENLIIDYVQGATVADLTIVGVQGAENVAVTITLDDQAYENNLYIVTFLLNIYTQYNHAPTVNFVPNQFSYLGQGEQSVVLTGISDGDEFLQNLTFIVESSNEAVLPSDNITIDYLQNNPTAELKYTAIDVGSTSVTLTIADDGGTEANNGDASIQSVFDIEIGNLPPTGHTPDISAFDTTNASVNENVGEWKIEGNLTAQTCQLGTFHGKENVIKIDISAKSCWTGLWYRCPELNVDKHRYLCYDIFFEGGSFSSNPGQTHSYYWDANNQRNLPEGHAQRKTVSEGQWETVFMDYRGPEGMINDDGVEINTKRIQQVLINYASSFGWPFPS